MNDRVRLTREQIDRLTFGIGSLDPAQRRKVRDMLYRLHDSADGFIGRQKLRLELSRMRKAYDISDIDSRNIDEAIFGG